MVAVWVQAIWGGHQRAFDLIPGLPYLYERQSSGAQEKGGNPNLGEGGSWLWQVGRN
jgi:hypothetical protein